MDTLERFPRRRADVAARVIGGEAVIVTPADTLVHELNRAATVVWEGCDGTRSGREIANELTAAFDVSTERAEADVEELLRTLSDKGLVDLLPDRTVGSVRES